MKNIKIIIVAGVMLPVIFFAGWIGMLEWQLAEAPEVKIAARGYDPRDLLSGHYLNLTLDWNATDCTQFKKDKCPFKRFDLYYRFYMPEKEAKELDLLIRRRTDFDINLIFSYPQNGSPRLKNMLINQTPWKQWLQREDKKHS